jgi:hypothetical protein
MAHVDRRLRLIEEWMERLQNARAGEPQDEDEPADAD